MAGEAFRISEFLGQVRPIKSEFGIVPAARGNDTSRRRIAILVIDEFLRLGGDVDQAFFLEANLYKNLKNCRFACNPTPEEIRIRELPRGKKTKMRRFDPLKLVSEYFEPKSRNPYPLTKAIIKILTEDEEDVDGVSGDRLRGGAPQTFKHLQKDTRLFTKQKGPSLYRAD